MARAWFFLVLLNSSSFSATRLSISCFTCPSSNWARRTLFSSCSRVPSASSRAPCSSSFSCSRRRLCLSRSWMERPPSPSWSRRSLISSARFLFSRLTMSSCSRPSSWAAFSLNSSEVKLRPSSWEAATSAETSAAFNCHSPSTLSKFLPLFSVMRAAACTLSYSMARSSSSLFILVLDFSALATLVVRASTSSSFSTIFDCSLLRAASSSSTRPMPSVSKRDFHNWISAWALERAFRESDFLMASFSIFSLRFSRSVAIILYLVNREERSLLSASARALVSSSWVVTEILPLFMLAMAASSSSIWRERAWFSTCSLFLEDSASLRARAISSSLVLASTMLPWSSLPLLSRSAVKVVLGEEVDGVLDELAPAACRADQLAIFASLAVVPAPESKQHLLILGLVSGHLLVEFVIKVGPGVVGSNGQRVGVKHRKAIDYVGTKVRLDIFWLVFASAGPVPCPIGVVADHLVFPIGSHFSIEIAKLSLAKASVEAPIILVIVSRLGNNWSQWKIFLLMIFTKASKEVFLTIRHNRFCFGFEDCFLCLCRGGVRPTCWTKNRGHGVHERVWSLPTSVLEVVQVQGPHHSTSESLLPHILRLLLDHSNIVETHPLPTLVSIRSDPTFRILNDSPASLLDIIADLIVGKETSGPCELSSCSLSSCWG